MFWKKGALQNFAKFTGLHLKILQPQNQPTELFYKTGVLEGFFNKGFLMFSGVREMVHMEKMGLI